MVSETGEEVMSACADFTQHAWKKELCVNCQRPRAEHPSPAENPSDSPKAGPLPGKDSPKPAKRNSLMTKSWTPMLTEDKGDDDDKWNAMCLPDPDQPNSQLGDNDKSYQRAEHCYEDIDAEEMKATVKSDSSKRHSTASLHSERRPSKSDTKTSTSDKRDSKSSSRENVSVLNVEERTNTFVRNGVRDSQSRSRSSSRDKSPAPALKPKPIDKNSSQVKPEDTMTKYDKSAIDSISSANKGEGNSRTNKGESSPRTKKKLKSGGRSISFGKDHEVIGNDGGLDNLMDSDEDDASDGPNSGRSEKLEFTDDEKEWALQALKNTIWNTEHVNADSDKNKTGAQSSREFEDLSVDSVFNTDRFSTSVKDGEQSTGDNKNFGTFPLRNKSEKAAMDNMFAGNRLSVLSESQENAYTLAKEGDDVEDKYESMLKYLGVDKDFLSSPKHKVSDKQADLDDDLYESNYDDPWEDKLVFDTDSDMNLLDEIKGEIDLDASGAGLALVDLLNDMLAKYSTGTPSETDSVKNLETLDDEKADKKEKKEVKEKPTAELEAKVATLAANIRKQRAKGRAPRPPSCPPEPPADVTKSPAKQLELRAQQSKEPTFKMVPIGKPIGGSPLAQSAQSAPSPASSNSSSPSNTLTSSTVQEPSNNNSTNNSTENIESYKIKSDKKEQKKSGGIGSFFSRFLRRGKDSETDLTATSTETLNSNSGSQSDLQGSGEGPGNQNNDKGSSSSLKKGEKPDIPKPEKRSSKASPQMKAKVLPVRPISPKPPDKPPHVKESTSTTTTDTEKDLKSSQRSTASSNGSSSTTTSGEKPSEDKSASDADSTTATKPPPLPLQLPMKPKEDKQSKKQLSPSKTADSKEQLAVSPKSKEAPPLPLNPPRTDITESQTLPRPRARGNSDGNAPRSRPRTRDFSDGKPRDIPSVPPPKPPVAAKPRPPTGAKSVDITDPGIKGGMPVQKDLLTTTKSLEDVNRKPDPNMLRKRAKSPKRMAAPGAPTTRGSVPNLSTDSTASLQSNASDSSVQNTAGVQAGPKTDAKGFAKELELKLTHKDQPVNISESRKLSAPPPPPPSTSPKADMLEKSKSLPKDPAKTMTKDKDISKSSPKDNQRSGSGSRDDLKISPPTEDLSKSKTIPTETENQSSNQLQNQSADIPIQVEKIELPRPVGNSRKSFLGKLNRKNRPPPPPSVKRTKSITEPSNPELHLKKIDVKDISGPVLITDMSSNKVVNRRNTITLGEDNAFHSGGSTSSGSTSAGEKSDLSPRGSIENLYEFITSEAPTPPGGDKKNLYDPVVEKTTSLRPPSVSGIEVMTHDLDQGYLEPVRSNQGPTLGEPVKSNMAESTMSLGSMTTSIVSMANSMATSITAMTQSVDHLEMSSSSNIDPSLESSDISDERRELLASQPIYEEINGYGKLGGCSFDEDDIDQSEKGDQIYGVNVVDGQQDNQDAAPHLPTLKSKDSFSSDSDLSSANNSLSRPRPIPRKRPRQVGSGFEQYVAMNRPSVAVFLNEQQLREMLNKLTAMNLQTLRELYAQHEKCFTKENLSIGAVGPLKWHDFNIYGKPLHMSEKCVMYNAKLKASMSPCQVMLLHSRPEITTANHPSLLKPTCIFNDAVPYSYLTEDFIRTSQILETCVAQSHLVKCYVVVGLFDITESVNIHLNNMQTVCENQREFLRKILFFVLQLLSAISHCLEQGHPLAEADFHDLYLISNPYCLGETVSFLPQVRDPEDQNIDSVCLFLERFLERMCKRCEANSVLDDAAFFTYTGIQKSIEMLQSGVMECLPIVRSYTEFLLWGPEETDPKLTDNRQSNLEPQLSMWLEKERSELIHDFAMRVQRGSRCNIKDFYKMKFLLKANASSLAECIRCQMSASA